MEFSLFFLCRCLAVLVGLALIFAVLRSCCRVALVNAPGIDGAAGVMARGVYGFMGYALRRAGNYPARQKILAWFAPCFLIVCIACYFIFTAAGFGLIYWAVHAEKSLFRSLIASGSALSTLGFCTPSEARGEIIAVIEGAVGLGIVVFLITFVPGYQSAIQRREEISAELYAHTDGCPSCEAVLNACLGKNTLPALWRDWAFFLRELGDIHASSPILIGTPSVRSGQSWVVSVFALMDAANFFVAVALEGADRQSARICLGEGDLSLKRMAEALRAERQIPPDVTPSRHEFNVLWARVESWHHSLSNDRDRAWAEFAATRAQYAPYLRFLARRLYVPCGDSLLIPR